MLPIVNNDLSAQCCCNTRYARGRRRRVLRKFEYLRPRKGEVDLKVKGHVRQGFREKASGAGRSLERTVNVVTCRPGRAGGREPEPEVRATAHSVSS